MLMGYLIRARGLDVAVAKTVSIPVRVRRGAARKDVDRASWRAGIAIGFLQYHLHVCSRGGVRRFVARSADRGPQLQAQPR